MVKYVLEAILICFWMSFAFIPNGILEKIRQLIMRFLWFGSREKQGLSWVIWDHVACQKICGVGVSLTFITLLKHWLQNVYGD
jgi:hypothetical protein